jgi:hypothetical protein
MTMTDRQSYVEVADEDYIQNLQRSNYSSQHEIAMRPTRLTSDYIQNSAAPQKVSIFSSNA